MTIVYLDVIYYGLRFMILCRYHDLPILNDQIPHSCPLILVHKGSISVPSSVNPAVQLIASMIDSLNLISSFIYSSTPVVTNFSLPSSIQIKCSQWPNFRNDVS